MNDVAVAEELAGLGEQFHDELLTPEHPAYDEARKLYNAMIDKRPALIARCRDVADVIAAVNHARDNGLDLAIRGGGHNGGGLGSVDNGVVADLSAMNDVGRRSRRPHRDRRRRRPDSRRRSRDARVRPRSAGRDHLDHRCRGAHAGRRDGPSHPRRTG